MRNRTVRPLSLLSLGVVEKGRSEAKGGGTIIRRSGGRTGGTHFVLSPFRRGGKDRVIQTRIHQATWTIEGRGEVENSQCKDNNNKK